MPRRMLINATHPDEVRVAVLDGAVLENYQTEVAEQGLSRGNIYRGTISNIQPGLNAAFIDYGAEKNGFLAIQDVVPEAYYKKPENPRRPAIDEVLEQGMPIVVQVQKEAEGGKGSSLTTNLSLAGRYLVLTPFDDTRGVSRKVEDEETRRKLRQAASSLDVPAGSGFIVRTNALDQNKAALARDLATLVRLWNRIAEEATRPAKRGEERRLLYDDQDLLLRALRDHLDASMDEILVDSDAAYDRAEQYMRAFLPRSKTVLRRYAERAPMFERFDVEHQIDRIFERTAHLPTGGYIVIDRTEALTAIDVNSGKATKAATQAETALTTNLEAAREVARQLRLRDIGGLVVVDFIDMRSPKSQRRLEKEMKDAMKDDRARFSVGRISPNGLLEINRQRIQQSLDRRAQAPCAHCEGSGRVPAEETVFQQILRRIEARAAVAPIRAVKLALHPEVAEAFRQSRKRDIAALERQFGLRVEIQPTRRVAEHAPEFEWVDRDRNDPGPHPPWTETALTEEVRWHAPLVPGPGDLPLAAAQRPSQVDGAARRETAERRGTRGAHRPRSSGRSERSERSGHRATAPNAADVGESAITASPRCWTRCRLAIKVGGASGSSPRRRRPRRTRRPRKPRPLRTARAGGAGAAANAAAAATATEWKRAIPRSRDRPNRRWHPRDSHSQEPPRGWCPHGARNGDDSQPSRIHRPARRSPARRPTAPTFRRRSTSPASKADRHFAHSVSPSAASCSRRCRRYSASTGTSCSTCRGATTGRPRRTEPSTWMAPPARSSTTRLSARLWATGETLPTVTGSRSARARPSGESTRGSRGAASRCTSTPSTSPPGASEKRRRRPCSPGCR